MAKISVAIASLNEERNIGDCLKSVESFADEVVVVDGSSSDRTREIAKELGARVIKIKNYPIFHINKNKAIEACFGDWILVLDADERVPVKLGKEMKKIARRQWRKDQPAGYWLKRKNLFLAHFLKKSGQYPDPVIRFFKKGKGKHPAVSVHEQIEINGGVGWLENELIHLGNSSFTRYLIRENRYSSLEAQALAKKGLKINLLNSLRYLVIKPLLTFFLIFIRHKGYQDGFPGFVFALFSGLHHAFAYIKFWEASQPRGKLELEKDWL
jgi:glycosyltransferase involved in cell wall biosynthesis